MSDVVTVDARTPRDEAAALFLEWCVNRAIWAHGMAHLWDNVALAVLCYTIAGDAFGITWDAAWITPGFGIRDA